MKTNLNNEKLEQELGSVLSPISPPNDFVTDLQERLKKKALVAIEHPDYLIFVILIIGGLFIGVVLIWLVKIFLDLFKSDD